MHACVDACMRERQHVCVQVCGHVCTCKYLHAFMHARLYAHACSCPQPKLNRLTDTTTASHHTSHFKNPRQKNLNGNGPGPPCSPVKPNPAVDSSTLQADRLAREGGQLVQEDRYTSYTDERPSPKPSPRKNGSSNTQTTTSLTTSTN